MGMNGSPDDADRAAALVIHFTTATGRGSCWRRLCSSHSLTHSLHKQELQPGSLGWASNRTSNASELQRPRAISIFYGTVKSGA